MAEDEKPSPRSRKAIEKAPGPETGKLSNPDEVEAFLEKLEHPLTPVLRATRRVVVEASPWIGEEIKWNGPSFFFTGPMPPSDPKKYLRYLMNINLFRKDCLRLIFVNAAGLADPAHLLEGDYRDGRRIVFIPNQDQLEERTVPLQEILRALVERVQAIGRAGV